MPRPKKQAPITVPEFISQEAKKISYTARKEAGKSVLKSQEVIEKLLFARSAGIPAISGIAGFAKINRMTLDSILKKGENGEGESFKLFFDAWNFVKEKINLDILEKYNAKLLNSDPSLKDLKQAIELRMQEYRPAQNVNIMNGDVHIKNQTMIANHAQKILQLPPGDIEKFIAQEAQALGISVDVNTLKPVAELHKPLPEIEIIDAEIVESGE